MNEPAAAHPLEGPSAVALAEAARTLARGPLPIADGDGTPALLPLLVWRALAPSASPDSARLGAALRDATCLAWAAMTLGEQRVGASAPPSGARAPSAVRVSALVAEACARLAAVAPRGSAWAAALADAWALHVERLAGAARPDGPASWELGRAGRRLAPLRALALCALEAGGRAELAPALAPLLDEAAGVYLGLRALRRSAVDAAAGLADPEEARTPPVAWIGPSATLARAHAAEWRRLGVGAVGALVDAWAEELESLRPEAPAPTPPVDAAPDDALAGALGAGLAALDDDPEGREAREIYRWGFLEVNPLFSTVFPHGTILENRLRAGQARPLDVDALLRRYAENRFHYFDQPTGLPFCTDTFGLVARLAPHASRPAEARGLLERPLRWVLANVGPDGCVPVFLSRGVDAGDGRRYIVTLSNACAAVQANLLRGLIALPEPRPDEAIRRVAAYLCARFAAEGAASFAHYEVLVGAHIVLEALQAVEVALPGEGTRLGVPAARERAVELVARACQSDRPSALELACRWLATARPETCALRRPAWLAELARAQEADGGWPAAFFYRMPSRGHFGEGYASRRVATSFACLALASAIEGGK